MNGCDQMGQHGLVDGLAAYLDANPALVVVLDPAGRIAALNRAGGELLGVAPEAARGADWFGFVPPEAAPEVRRVFAAIMAGDQSHFASYENDVVTAGGERRTLVWRNAVVPGADGRPRASISTGIDITARKALESRLAASEATYRIVAVHTDDWETWYGPDGTLRYCSPSCQRITGHPAEAFLADPGLLERLLHPDDAPAVAAHLAALPSEGPPCDLYFRIRSASGEERRLHHRCVPVHDDAGRYVGRRASNRDVTERWRAERALRESEALYRSLFNATPSGVLVTDPAGHFLAFNDRAAAMLGYERAEFSRLRIWHIDAEQDEARVKARVAEVLRDGHLEYDARLRAKDGGLREVHVRVARVFLGDAPAVLSVWDDLTEARRLERELRLRLAERDERELWLQASQRVARIGHYAFDVQADRWESSPMLDELFGIDAGYPRTAAGWLALIHPEEREAMAARFQALLSGDGPAEWLYRVQRGDGPVRWVQGLAVLERDAHGRPARVVGTIQDVTARRTAEQAQAAMAEQLRQSQKLESIGRLAGGVAHDFNNLLVVFLGCADALRRSLEEGRPPAREDVDELEEAARRARDLTSQLLAFARRQVVAPAVLDLNAEVRRAQRMLQRVLGEDVRLELSLQADPPHVSFDPGQLQQVLMNLALNARDAMPTGGRLAIATTLEAPLPAGAGWIGSPVQPGLHVRLLVEDTGHGIPAELWPRIFEPFLTTKAPGAPRAPARTARPGERILVVEDDHLVRATTCRALTQAGYLVTSAAGGAEVAALLEGGAPRPDLLLTDVVMPGSNGRQVAQAAQAAWPGLKVLFMSGYAQDIIVHHGVVDPGLELLEKPFTGEALLARVRDLLDG
ncbi:MAG: PAS domain S-box protein [Anaeromyxobacteraceae bacterium]|nr:PAS domain S-box protein [Anaeromyxobacteraceae bacterium]